MSELDDQSQDVPGVDVARGVVNRLKVLVDPVRRGDDEQFDAVVVPYLEQMRELLTMGAVDFRAEVDGLWFGGAELTGRDLVGRALLDGLSGEGLKRVRILVSAPEEEMVALARLLARDWGGREAGSAGLEAAFWASDLRHVLLEFVHRSLRHAADEVELEPDEVVVRLFEQMGLRSADWASRHEVVTGLAERLTLLGELTDGPTTASTVGLYASHPQRDAFRQHLSHAEAAVHDDFEQVALTVFWSVRHAPTGEHAAETIRAAGFHLRQAAAAGNVALAGAIARRLGTLAQPETVPDWDLLPAVSGALGELLDEEMTLAVVAGMQRTPDTEAWRGLLFSLGQLADPSRLEGILCLGRPLADRTLLQALADAMLLVADRGNTNLRDVLVSADEADLPVVLYALGRRPDPTLVEQVLARERSSSDEVREAVLVALRPHQSPRIKEVMRNAVADAARPVRMEALRYLSVYRDSSAVGDVSGRLLQVEAKDADAEELKALAIAWGLMTRGAALETLALVADGTTRAKHPDASRAAIHGIKVCGTGGRAVLDGLGRSHPELRDEIRSVLGGVR